MKFVEQAHIPPREQQPNAKVARRGRIRPPKDLLDARHANKGSAKAVLAKWNVKNVRQAASPVPRDFRTVQNVRRVTTNPHRVSEHTLQFWKPGARDGTHCIRCEKGYHGVKSVQDLPKVSYLRGVRGSCNCSDCEEGYYYHTGRHECVECRDDAEKCDR